jgi:H+-translocating NAD(P) transhydrogenase subunit alpha
MNIFNILVVKESREGEKRVSLLPNDVKKLSDTHTIFVESGAGNGIGIADQEYVDAGATIRIADDLSSLFANIDLVVRVKRANHEREGVEFTCYPKGLVVIGALDPLETNSSHIELFKKNEISGISIDQLRLNQDDPMNILAAMSTITGRLALLDAVDKHEKSQIHNVLILGYGAVARSALKQALQQNMHCFVLITQKELQKELLALGVEGILIHKTDPIEKTRERLLPYAKKADIVIAAARANMQKAPILIDDVMQENMKKGAVIVDLALSEGGNIANSQHDATLKGKGGVIITNISGYPKLEPKIASQKWSLASRLCIEALSKNLHALDEAIIK